MSDRGDQTRQALLVAARAAFARKGFKATTVRGVAADAGVHPALVTYHFKTKQALYDRVIDHALDELRAALVDAFGQAPDLKTGARNAVDGYLQHLEANPEFPLLVQRGLLDGDESLARRIGRDHWGPIIAATSGLSDDLRDTVYDVFLTLLSATAAPFLYAPLLAHAFPEEAPLSHASLQRRRKHLMVLIDALI